MKNRLPLLCLLSVLGAYAIPCHSQNLRTIDKVSDLLEKAEVFKVYRHFRTEFQQTNQDLGNCIDNYEDYQKLNAAYNEVRTAYNGLLEEIRTDLSDWDRVQQIIKKPDAFSTKYLTSYSSVIEAYKTDYIPVYNDLNARTEEACDKAIPPVLIEVGALLFEKIVDLIKSRKEGKAAIRNVILVTVNHYFYEKLAMKTWADLDIKTPAVSRPTKTNSSPTNGSAIENQKQGSKISDSDEDSPVVPVPVGRPFISTMSGWVQFIYVEDPKKAPKRMIFFEDEGKDIEITTWNAANGKVQPEKGKTTVRVFGSEDSYRDSSYFQLRVKNTAGMYVLALNSGNKVNFLYPPAEANLRPCDKADDLDKDIKQSSFIVAKDENDVTTLPAPLCTYADEPPVEQYFQMSGNVAREQFCIILSRAELDVSEIVQKLEAQEGPLDERVARIFGDEIISAKEGDVNMKGNRLIFDATNSLQNVLPLVFYIERRK